MPGIHNTSWADSLQALQPAFPVAVPLSRKLQKNSQATIAVREAYQQQYGRIPGRCAVLVFHEDHVVVTRFPTPFDVREYLDGPRQDDKAQHRLWLLEDLEPEWLEVLGPRLDIDPLVLGEQMNTFNFLDSQTVHTRLLPSMVDPATSFTLRYFELRQLTDPESILANTNQMTFDVNSRRIERWLDIDTKKYIQRYRHSFTRRCASFWSNQDTSAAGWDAVMFLDPAYDSFKWTEGRSPPACTILQDPVRYDDRDTLWSARGWTRPGSFKVTRDTSIPYHGGTPTIAKTARTYASGGNASGAFSWDRNRMALFDEQILYWTSLATPAQIAAARSNSVNSAHFLLKSIAYMWSHNLDFVQGAISQSEYFADDNQASIDSTTTGSEWRKRLNDVAESMGDMHFFRRQMNFFQSHLELNLERLGIVRNGMSMMAGQHLPSALADAQKDFIHLHSHLLPYVARVSALSSLANELTNLHTSFKSVQDSESGLIVSTIAIVVFPATLVASIFSMGGDYLPGQDQFWVFWATAVPITLALGVLMMFSGVLKRYAESRIASWQRRYLARQQAKNGLQQKDRVHQEKVEFPSKA